MTFMNEARQVADIAAPLEHRYWALCHCIERFSPLGFRATLEYLATTVGVTGSRWTSDQLTSGLDLLMEERNRFLAFDAQWIERRRARKLAGRRIVERDELLEREAMPWLTWQRDTIRNRRTFRVVWAPDDAIPFRPNQRAEYETVLALMPPATHHSSLSFDVRVYDDWLRIPTRIYNPVPSPDDRAPLSDRQSLMLNCLYSRHNDGYVRQQHLRRLLEADEPWVAPYVVALVGEYVIEIVQDIAAGLANIATDGTWQHRLYGRFANDNPGFIELTKSRVESYWAAYYWPTFSRPGPDLAGRPEYPGFGLVRALRKASTER